MNTETLPVREPEDAAQPLFSAEEACPKCGQTRLYDADGRGLRTHQIEYVAAADMLRVTCGWCGYQWGRRPLDDQLCTWKQQGAAGVRWCGLRAGHVAPHDFNRETDDTLGGSPW